MWKIEIFFSISLEKIVVVMLLCGVDEAGKGAVLGSLVVVAVVIDEEKLKTLPVKDSKKLSKKRRELLRTKIVEVARDISVCEITSEQINKFHDQGQTLNQIDCGAFSKALNGLKVIPDKVCLDAADVNPERFKNNVKRDYKNAEHPEFLSKHKADDTEAVVSAASIVAKVVRDSIMAEIAPVSGYPDKPTKEWLADYYRKHGKFPPQSRSFWKTLDNVRKMVAEK